MRYVVVTDRIPKWKTEVICPICPTIIAKGYTRDLETQLCYCTPDCLEAHVFASTRAIEHAPRAIV
jgi:hypothetical protein